MSLLVEYGCSNHTMGISSLVAIGKVWDLKAMGDETIVNPSTRYHTFKGLKHLTINWCLECFYSDPKTLSKMPFHYEANMCHHLMSVLLPRMFNWKWWSEWKPISCKAYRCLIKGLPGRIIFVANWSNPNRLCNSYLVIEQWRIQWDSSFGLSSLSEEDKTVWRISINMNAQKC